MATLCQNVSLSINSSYDFPSQSILYYLVYLCVFDLDL